MFNPACIFVKQGGGGTVPAYRRTQLLDSEAIADPGTDVTFTEVTLTQAITANALLEFVSEATPSVVGYLSAGLLLEQTDAYSVAPAPGATGIISA